MAEVTVSSKNQIVVPREAREALRLRPGAKLQVVVRGDTVLLFRKPKSATRALAGLGRGMYPPRYLDEERRSW
jgi:AbrB family looped-hinge helix DNA binding protein